MSENQTNYHLAILKRPYLDAILSGRKRIESRFMKTRHSPFGQVRRGDRLFFKLSSGPVCGTARVSAVKYYENLTAEKILKIKQKYNGDIGGTDNYWLSKTDCIFGVLIWLEQVRQIEPVRIYKRDWRAWVVLTDKQNFGLVKMCSVGSST